MKRSISLLFVLVPSIAACGGGNATPAAPAPDVASSAAPPPADAPPSAAPTASAAPAAAEPSAAPSASASAPKTTMAVSAGAGPAEAAAAPAAASDPSVPAVSTTQKGFLHQQLAGTEVVFITVADAGASCASVAKAPSNGDKRVELRTLWKPGFYTMTSRTSQVSFDSSPLGKAWQKGEASGDGGVQVRAAPLAEGGTGRIHVQAKRGKDAIDAEIEVAVCTAVDFSKVKKK